MLVAGSESHDTQAPEGVGSTAIMSLEAQHPPLVVVMGPTASGKTSLALELADRLPGGGELIGADSMQIYRKMSIGTAKPTAEERARAPHHLLDVADPHTGSFTVHDWLARARTAIEEIRERGARPIVVGGTNLYVRALLEGLIEGPAPDPALRARLEEQPLDALREELERVDPGAAERIHRNDRRRSIRALEVYHTSGTSLSEQQVQWAEERIAPREDTRLICLDWPTEVLNRRINARVKVMVAEGLVDEVRGLLAEGPLSEQAASAVGYREIEAHLKGDCTLEDAQEQIKIRTRRFAKQQRTWMRRFHQVPNTLRLAPADRSPEDLATEAMDWLTGLEGVR